MKIVRVTVTPIAFRDPPLLNASGIHEPFALRSIIEIESDNGYIGLGESYGDAPALLIQQQLQPLLIGLDPFNLNQLCRTGARLPCQQSGKQRLLCVRSGVSGPTSTLVECAVGGLARRCHP